MDMKNFKQSDHEDEIGSTRLGPSGTIKATQ
jgi:hypothetical protein